MIDYTRLEGATKISAAPEIINNNFDKVDNLISQQSSENVKQNNDIALLNRKVSALEQLNEGVSYRFETDSTEAYSKTIPSGAKVFDLKLLGGKSVVANQLVDVISLGSANNFIKTNYNGKIALRCSGNNVDSYFGFYVNKGVLPNNKYYVSFYADFNNNDISITYTLNNNIASSSYLPLKQGKNSLIFVPNSEYETITWDDGVRTSIGTYYITDIRVVNLTQWFGAGNEPTVKEFETMVNVDNLPFIEPTIVSQSVENVRVRNKAGEITHNLTIPNEWKQLDCYGVGINGVYNEIDFENKQYIQRIGKLEFGDNYRINPNSGSADALGYLVSKNTTVPVVIQNAKAKGCGIHSYFTVRQIAYPSNANTMTIASAGGEVTYFRVAEPLNVNDYTNLIKDTVLYYELAEPIITDISDLLDNRFEAVSCEANGSITFEANTDYKLPIPNEEEYMIKLSEV